MRSYNYILLLLSTLCVASSLSGCLGDTAGISPPDDELVFPVALAAIQDDSHLLVVNSNFNLEYNAGTLVAYALDSIDTVKGMPMDYDAQAGAFELPLGTVFADYCTAGRTATHCSLDPSAGIITEETIRLGAFASAIEITPDKDRALIPIRGERSVVMVDIQDRPNLLDCGETETSDRRCNDLHRVTSNDAVSFPIEPRDITSMKYVHEENGVEIVDTLGFVSHQAGGEVSLFWVAQQQGDGPIEYKNKLITVKGGVIEGASGLAVNPQKQELYLVGQRDPSPHVAIMQVSANSDRGGSYTVDPTFTQTNTIRIASEGSAGAGARDIAVSPDGNTGFVITQSPPSLLKLDLRTNELIDSTTVCREASKVSTFVDEQDPDNPLDDKLYAFVLCFYTSQVYIVDADYMVPVIRKTGEGPQDISFDESRKIAYIANFSESTISMIQAVAPFNLVQVRSKAVGSDSLIVRIGVPNQPKGN